MKLNILFQNENRAGNKKYLDDNNSNNNVPYHNNLSFLYHRVVFKHTPCMHDNIYIL